MDTDSFAVPYTELLLQAIASKGKTKTLFAGQSMSPLIKSGDHLLIEKKDPARLNTGEIIAYKRGRKIVVHRIIKILGEGERRSYITKGDNSLWPDLQAVRKEGVAGVVTGIFPRGDSSGNTVIKAGLIPKIYVIIGLISLHLKDRRRALPGSVRHAFFYAAKTSYAVLRNIISLCARGA
ncbi:MAG: signal peptidase I [Candidatus Omnitrophica bacterium]|nr:signal peptidase I [Candidatus Omnitrophota bacterium]